MRIYDPFLALYDAAMNNINSSLTTPHPTLVKSSILYYALARLLLLVEKNVLYAICVKCPPLSIRQDEKLSFVDN